MRLLLTLFTLMALSSACVAQDAGLMPANTVFAGPTSGGAAFGTARAIVAGDINGLVPSFGGLTLTNLTGSGTSCVQVNNSGVFSATGAACGSGSGAVNSVSNSDGTLTISPTTGVVVASLNVGHANTWTAAQSFNSSDLILNGATSGTTTLIPTAIAGTTTATLPANTGTIAELNLAQSWTAKQTFSPSIQVPLVIGGAAVSSTLTLESTSAAGTTDKISFKTSTQIERTRIDTSGQLSETNFAAAFTSGIPSIGGAPLVISAISNSTGFWEFGTQTYGSGFPGGWATLVSRGSGPGTHTIAQLGDTLFSLNYYSDDGSNYIDSSQLNVIVDNTPSLGNIPTKFQFVTGGSESLQIASTQQTIAKIFRGYTDLREWSNLSCNHGSPTSSNVATAVVNAYNAGWRGFFIPDGCFVWTGDSTWVSTFGTNVIPNSTNWLGENAQTSGISTCSNYDGTTCAPSAATTLNHSGGNFIKLQNLFEFDGGCYNVDSSAFGHPSRCPLGLSWTGGGSFGGGAPYPSSALIGINIGAETNGSWNGTDTPGFAENNETQGDNIFLQSVPFNNGVANFLNLFGNGGGLCSSQQVGKWTSDGRASFGASACTPHSGPGTITVIDSLGSCGIFANSSGGIGSSCSSDRRLKDDIVDTGDALGYINSFRIRDYTMKSDGNRYTGSIAQEVMQTNPDMVREGEDGMLQVFAPNQWKMIKAMQQMQAEIEDLKRRVH